LEENCEDDINIIDLTIALSGTGVNANPHIGFMVRVMTSDLLISEFPTFKEVIKDLFNQCKSNNSGKPADYIPELAKAPPKNWGVAICTVQGQRAHFGHSKYPFSI
jgi:glutaminase